MIDQLRCGCQYDNGEPNPYRRWIAPWGERGGECFHGRANRMAWNIGGGRPDSEVAAELLREQAARWR